MQKCDIIFSYEVSSSIKRLTRSIIPKNCKFIRRWDSPMQSEIFGKHSNQEIIIIIIIMIIIINTKDFWQNGQEGDKNSIIIIHFPPSRRAAPKTRYIKFQRRSVIAFSEAFFYRSPCFFSLLSLTSKPKQMLFFAKEFCYFDGIAKFFWIDEIV